MGGEVGVAGLPGGRGALADWGSLGVVLLSLMGCLNRVSLICSGRAPGLAAAGRGFESLQPHCQACGVSRGALWGKLSLGRTFCWEISPSDVEGLGMCEKKAKSCDSKGCCKTGLQWGFSLPQRGQASFCDSLWGAENYGVKMGLGLTRLPVFQGSGGTRQQNAGLMSSRGSVRKDLMGPP